MLFSVMSVDHPKYTYRTSKVSATLWKRLGLRTEKVTRDDPKHFSIALRAFIQQAVGARQYSRCRWGKSELADRNPHSSYPPKAQRLLGSWTNRGSKYYTLSLNTVKPHPTNK